MSEDKWASYHVCAARLGANDVTEGASVERVVQVVYHGYGTQAECPRLNLTAQAARPGTQDTGLNKSRI